MKNKTTQHLNYEMTIDGIKNLYYINLDGYITTLDHFRKKINSFKIIQIQYLTLLLLMKLL